jgi:alpha-N-arabinofuranosidase
MYRRTFLSAFSGAAIGLAENGGSASATVSIDPAAELGRIDPRIFGHFLEHVERVVYGGVFEPGSRYSDEFGLRTDVIQAIKEMGGARIMRWPGGNFASYYRWKDGIGPRQKRPRRFDVVWKQYESNHFGTDEFLALCRRLECEPFITVNMGNGTLEEACEWVEYCRRSDRKPPVRVWGLGNEVWGPWQVGHSSATEYVRKTREFGQFVRAVEPDLQYVGVGHTDEAWNETVLKGCGELLEWLTIHLYSHRHFLDGEDDYDSTVAAPAIFEREMGKMAAQIENWERNSKRTSPLQICLEEWNARHFRKDPAGGKSQLLREDPRNIVDALFTAGVLNACQRLAARVSMTNYVFIVNAHGPLFVYPDGLLKTSLFDVYRLYATRQQSVSVAAKVDGGILTAAVRSAPPTGNDRISASLLDVSATVSPDRKKLSLAMVNRHRDKACQVTAQVKGRRFAPGAVLHTVFHPDLRAVNSRNNPGVIRATERNIPHPEATIELPRHSVNILEVNLA